VSYKYASLGADSVVDDLRECNGRTLSNRYCKMLGDAVGTFAAAKEESWEYALPEFDQPVASASVGVDGTCMLLVEDGWRVAMTGTIALYDAQGERLHTIYLGAAPEYGKEEFHARFVRELERVKARFPEIPYLGLSDGATDNWSFLSPLTDHQLVDFYHASEYVGKAGMAMFGVKHAKEREAWLADRLHRLKHNQGAATRLWKEMDEYARLPHGRRNGDAASIDGRGPVVILPRHERSAGGQAFLPVLGGQECPPHVIFFGAGVICVSLGGLLARTASTTNCMAATVSA
jgi:hypothetical protein